MKGEMAAQTARAPLVIQLLPLAALQEVVGRGLFLPAAGLPGCSGEASSMWAGPSRLCLLLIAVLQLTEELSQVQTRGGLQAAWGFVCSLREIWSPVRSLSFFLSLSRLYPLHSWV